MFAQADGLRETNDSMVDPRKTKSRQTVSTQMKPRLNNRHRFAGRKFSRGIPIEKLIKLDLNSGPGEFVQGPDDDSLCLCIKR